MHNYVDSFQCLPFGKGDNYMPEIMSAPTYARWSTHSQALVFLEQTTLFNAINFNLPPETPFMDNYNMGFMPVFQDPNRENSTVCRIAITAFLCPSDPAGPAAHPAGMVATITTATRDRGCATPASRPPARSRRAISPRTTLQPKLRQPGQHDRWDQSDCLPQRTPPWPGNARLQDRHVHDGRRA